MMCEPRPLTPLWAFTAFYRDIFTFFTFTDKVSKLTKTTQSPNLKMNINIGQWREKKTAKSKEMYGNLRIAN
jgi:hypothetical protein